MIRTLLQIHNRNNDIKSYIQDFSQLLLISLVFVSDKSNDQILSLSKLTESSLPATVIFSNAGDFSA